MGGQDHSAVLHQSSHAGTAVCVGQKQQLVGMPEPEQRPIKPDFGNVTAVTASFLSSVSFGENICLYNNNLGKNQGVVLVWPKCGFESGWWSSDNGGAMY